MIKTMVFQTRH